MNIKRNFIASFLFLALGLFAASAARAQTPSASTTDETPSVHMRMLIPSLGGAKIDVFAFDSQTVIEDSTTGGSGGRIKFGPLTVSKRIDGFTPALTGVHFSGQHLPEVTLKWFRVNPTTHTDQLFFTMRLTDVTISAMHTRLPNQQDPALMKLSEVEEVTLEYHDIEMIK